MEHETATSMRTANHPAPETPLLVDFATGLSRTDILHERAFSAVRDEPRAAGVVLVAAAKGRAALERTLDRLEARPRSVAADPQVLDSIRAARSEGRRTVLVADDPAEVSAIGGIEDLFDDIATPEDAVANYARAGYDLVAGPGADPTLRESASRIHQPERRPSEAYGATYLRALRPHQWSKNLLVFMPLLASHSLQGAGFVVIAFVAFCLTASSVYILNDLMDLDADRAHARKRNRAFASGALPIGSGILLSVILLLVAILLSAVFTPPRFLAVLLLYYAMTFAYSVFLKRLLVIDVMILAALYTLRIIGGGEAAELEITPWMLAFSMFLFLSLAAIKRQGELVDRLESGETTSAGRAYVVGDLPIVIGMVLAGGYASVLVLALYISSPEIVRLYESPSVLWLICPVMLYWVSRMGMVTHRGRMHDDPIVFAATDRVSQISVLLSVIFVIWAAFF